MKMNKFVAAACVATTKLALCAGMVTRVSDGISVDGRLAEPCWAAAEWNGGFVRPASSVKDRAVTAQTSFAIVSDERTLYVAIKCDEPDMTAMKSRQHGPLHACNQVELFLSPRGDGFDFYQFVIGFDPRSGHEARYASEGGNISPDPYGPEWKFARGEFDGGWCVEVAIPFSSFYMTRNGLWRDTWRVNVARRWANLGHEESTTWSPLERSFLEPNNFRTIRGFPKRSDEDDVAITDVTAELSGRRGDNLAGTLTFTATVAQGGEYEVSSPFAVTTTIALKPGANSVCIPCVYPANGRHDTRIELKRKATGETYARTYPVVVDFEDIRLSLTSPEYRNNFYPGQDASRVRGRVMCAVDREVLVTLAGPGFTKRESRLSRGGGEIDFDTTGFEDGTALLSVEVGGVKKEFKIRKLAPTGRRMAWISKGCIVVDGKPVLRREVGVKGYKGGRAFAERFDADKRLYLTPEVSMGGTLEPNRVIKGLEMREARKDVMPCKEYFDKVDELIEKSKDKDFAYWYIADEPECRGVSPIYLRHIYEYMKEKDPYHIIRLPSRAGKKYIECADWFETHPYLNVHYDGRGNRRMDRHPNEIGAFIDAFEASDHPDKCVGFVPTMFAYRFTSILNDYPTFPEYVCHVWAAMMRGAKTLGPFYYADMGDRAALYEGNRYVNSTFATLEDFILFGKRTTLLKTPEAECVRWDIPGGASMFALANFTAEDMSIPLPDGLSDRKWRPFRCSKAFDFHSSSSPYTFTLSPYEVVVGVTEERGADLETYAEVQTLVDRLERERTSRDNQILEEYMSLGFASSNGKTLFYKLIDGTRDVLGWNAKGKDPWVEFSFTGKPVSFSSVRVYGSGLEDMKVSIRKDGEWKELAPKSSNSEKYMKEVGFGEVLSTVKMRLSFPAKKGISNVELYEVELPAVKDVTAPSAANADGDRVGSPLPAVSSADVLWSLYDGGATVSRSARHMVPIDPGYPWLEFEVDSFARQKDGVYSAWLLWFLKHGQLAGGVTHPQTGRYVVRKPKKEKPVKATLRLDDHNLDIGVKRLRCVKNPTDFIVAEVADGAEAIRPGCKLDVAVTLAAPCADVATTLLVDRGCGAGLEGFLLNGTNAIDLKATADGGGRVWNASIPVKSCGNAEAHKVYVKCVVLGGVLKVPLFTTINQPFKSDV